MKKINTLLADDHPVFLEGIHSLLKHDPEIHLAGMARNGSEALELLQRHPVDVLICDISMPGMNGLELSQLVKKLYPHIGILILTMHEEQKIIGNLLKAGVKGYLFKNADKEQLLVAIKTVAAGSVFVSDEVKNRIVLNISRGADRELLIPALSAREKEVLGLVAREYTTQQIAEQLFISHHTVLSHRKKLLYKFNVNNTAGLIKKAAEAGLLDR